MADDWDSEESRRVFDDMIGGGPNGYIYGPRRGANPYRGNGGNNSCSIL
jgi:hypothetical protein